MLRGVDILRAHFGSISDLDQPTSTFLMFEVAWSTGTLEYWSQHPESVKITFPVTFSKLGRGYLQAEACRIGPEWQLRAIHYGLPQQSPGALARIGSVTSELISLVRSPNSR